MKLTSMYIGLQFKTIIVLIFKIPFIFFIGSAIVQMWRSKNNLP